MLYKKHTPGRNRGIIRYAGLTISIISGLIFLYIIYPVISWRIFFEPVFAYNSLTSPIPKNSVLTSNNIKSLITTAVGSINIDYQDAKNWYPDYINTYKPAVDPSVITTFNISIPKLKIYHANVSALDTDLSKHLILYPGTAVPPNLGNAVIFGHSTLPGLFKPQNYSTIFATLHTLKKGDVIMATVNAKEYKYLIESINITTPDDTSIFTQDSDDSYLTLLTCTPPGTTWKRLIIKAKISK